MTPTLAALAARRRLAQADLEKVMGELRRAVLSAVAGGMSQAQAAREAGIDRMTVREWIKQDQDRES